MKSQITEVAWRQQGTQSSRCFERTYVINKKYAPDISNTYEYDKYDNWFTTKYEINLEVCADILHRRFNDRFFKHINDLEADELSGAETEIDK